MHRSAFLLLKWLGFFLAATVAAISAIMGALEDMPTQDVMLYTIAIFAVILWGWHHLTVRWTWQPASYTASENSSLANEFPSETAQPIEVDNQQEGSSYFGSLIKHNKSLLISVGLMIVVFMAVAFAVDGFLQWRNILAVVILLLLLAITVLINKNVKNNKSGLMGTTVLIGLFIIGTLVVDGFLSTLNLKSMLLFAAFLGLACIGQTLVALLGGLDLSIPFVIGSSNIGLMYLFNLGLPPWICIITILLVGAAIGFVNGVLSFRLQGQALILTLGVGFAVSGGTQILTTIGSSFWRQRVWRSASMVVKYSRHQWQYRRHPNPASHSHLDTTRLWINSGIAPYHLGSQPICIRWRKNCFGSVIDFRAGILDRCVYHKWSVLSPTRDLCYWAGVVVVLLEWVINIYL